MHSWGCAAAGELGQHGTPHAEHPVRIVLGDGSVPADHMRGVVMLAAGHRHWAAVRQDGRVLTCGSGYRGQLGHGDRDDYDRALVVTAGLFGLHTVSLVACGRQHTIALTSAGQLYGCGNHQCGQVGVGPVQSQTGGGGVHIDVFTRVHAPALGPHRVIFAACGGYHSLAITTQGRVLSWGRGLDGRLGLDCQEGHDVFAPQAVTGGGIMQSVVVCVAGGGAHSVAVAECGTVFAWGAGGHGQLGLGHTGCCREPTPLEAREQFGGCAVRMAVCGDTHSMAITAGGSLWVWGNSRVWNSGVSEGRRQRPDRHGELVPRLVPREWFDGDVITAAAGGQRSGCCTEHGTMYTWGQATQNEGDRDVQRPMAFSSILFGGRKVGRTHVLPPEFALALAMGTHARLGGGQCAGSRDVMRLGHTGHACPFADIGGDLLKQIVEACVWQPSRREAGGAHDGLRRLMAGGLRGYV